MLRALLSLTGLCTLKHSLIFSVIASLKTSKRSILLPAERLTSVDFPSRCNPGSEVNFVQQHVVLFSFAYFSTRWSLIFFFLFFLEPTVRIDIKTFFF